MIGNRSRNPFVRVWAQILSKWVSSMNICSNKDYSRILFLTVDLVFQLDCFLEARWQWLRWAVLVYQISLFSFAPLRSWSISACLLSARTTSTMWSSLWMWWRRTRAARGSSLRPRTTSCWRIAVESSTAPERDREGPQVNTVTPAQSEQLRTSDWMKH